MKLSGSAFDCRSRRRRLKGALYVASAKSSATRKWVFYLNRKPYVLLFTIRLLIRCDCPRTGGPQPTVLGVQSHQRCRVPAGGLGGGRPLRPPLRRHPLLQLHPGLLGLENLPSHALRLRVRLPVLALLLHPAGGNQLGCPAENNQPKEDVIVIVMKRYRLGPLVWLLLSLL